MPESNFTSHSLSSFMIVFPIDGAFWVNLQSYKTYHAKYCKSLEKMPQKRFFSGKRGHLETLNFQFWLECREHWFHKFCCVYLSNGKDLIFVVYSHTVCGMECKNSFVYIGLPCPLRCTFQNYRIFFTQICKLLWTFEISSKSLTW